MSNQDSVCSACSLSFPAGTDYWPYANGKPSGRRCKKCHSLASMLARRKNKEATNKSNAAWKARHSVQNSQINKAWREANIDKARSGPLQWAKDNPDRHNALSAKRRAARNRQTPRWLSRADYADIEAKYAMAKWLSEVVGVPYHVDHIAPLRGEMVSGLHVPDNLAVLRATENLQKSNRWVV